MSWKSALCGQIRDDWAREIDIFETQLELRQQGRIDEKPFAETRLRRGVYGQRFDNGQRHDGVATRTLPFPERCFDAVLSQFGLMFFVERPAAIAEMLRVLKPGGRIAVAVWGALEDNGAYSVAVELLDRLAGRAAADALRAPFALGRPGPLRDLFEAAGVAGTEVVMRPGTARFPSVRVLMEAELRGWLPLLGVRLDEAVIDRILGEAESALAAYAGADGAVVFPLQALVVSGGRP